MLLCAYTNGKGVRFLGNIPLLYFPPHTVKEYVMNKFIRRIHGECLWIKNHKQDIKMWIGIVCFMVFYILASAEWNF